MAKRPRSRRVLLIALAAVVLAALAVGGWFLRGRFRAEKEDREIAALKAKLNDRSRGSAEEHYRLGIRLVELAGGQPAGQGPGQESPARTGQEGSARSGEDSHAGSRKEGRTGQEARSGQEGRPPNPARPGQDSPAQSRQECLGHLEIAVRRAPVSLLFGHAPRF